MTTEIMNPYHYALSCMAGKWKMPLLNHIYHYGFIRFTKTKSTFPVSEKVLSEQLKSLITDGLIERKMYDEVPLRVEYTLTETGEKLIPAINLIYSWSVLRMRELGITIDPDAFAVHSAHKHEVVLKPLLAEFDLMVDVLDLGQQNNMTISDIYDLLEDHINKNKCPED